ncbi:PAS domain S-box-containing protein [Catalinimonas alkaloidigena]|uniref:histidine kinase n=1 Tax=Catalinimonas alkaloidigena TaxID=1075417 RepID=A0A1G9DDF8_9BACT|nr:PAS domain S-box protein [Catalinimonas alkaloidigena]SDK61931.1 PAS domain S-box-containing protein [Catalinimonas alkaloidigena]
MPSIKVLIVEDEMIISKDLEMRLRNMGYVVTGTVSNSDAALQSVRDKQPDVILMDIMIDGDLDGIETAELIHREIQIPVIYLTAFADESTFQRAKLSDPFGYILKPCQDRELDLTIRTVMHKHSVDIRLREGEKQVRESLNLMRLFFSQSLDAAFFMELDEPINWRDATTTEKRQLVERAFHTLHFTQVNEVMSRQYGRSQEELITLRYHHIFAFNPELGRQHLLRLYESGTLKTEFYQQINQEHGIWVEGEYSCIYNPEGHIVGHFGLRRDVTEQRKARQVLENSERQYKLLFADSPLPMWIYDIKTLRFLAVNWVAQQVYGYTEEEFLSMRIVDICSPGEVEALQESLKTIDGAGTLSRVWQQLRKDGTSIYVDVNSQPQQFEGRKARLVVATDITAKIMAEEALRKSEVRYRSLFENTNESIVVVDDQGVLQDANRATARLYDSPIEELIGQPLYSLFPSCPQEKFEHLWQELSQKADMTRTFDFRRPDGQRRYVELKAQSHFLPGLHLGVLRDVTPERNAQTLVNLQRDVLEMVARGNALDVILEQICQRIEETEEGVIPAVTLLNEGCVSRTVGASLPSDYQQAMVGRCATTAQESWGMATVRKEAVWTHDIAEDPAWQEVRTLALKHSLRACGSTPVLDYRGRVIATLDLYYTSPQRRQPNVLPLVDVTCSLIGLAVERESDYESLYKQALTFEKINDAVIITDPANRIQEWSPSAQRLFGYSKEEAIGKDLGFLQHSAPSPLSQTSAVGLPDEVEFITKDQQGGIAETMATALKDKRGKVYGTLYVLREVTQQRLAERSLREYEERFRKVFTANPTAILISDFQTDLLVDANDSFLRLTGYTREQLLGRPSNRLSFWSDQAQRDEIYRQLRKGRTVLNYPMAFVAEQGDLRYVNTSFERIQANESDLVIAMINDVTEQRKAEEAVRKSEAYYKSLIQHSTDLVTLLKADGEILYESPSVTSLLGYDLEEMMGERLYSFMDADSQEELRTVLETHVHDPEEIHHIEIGLRHKNGEWRYFDGSVKNLLHNPDVGGIVVNSRDITDRRRIERALSRSEANLKAIFETTIQAFVLLDNSYRVQTFNKTARQLAYSLTGKSPEPGHSVLEYLMPEWTDGFKKRFQEAARGRYISLEKSVSTPFGSQLWLEVSFLPVYNQHKEITSICFTALDIQDRKNTELALAESEARFRSLVQNSSDITTVLNEEGYVSYTSESTYRYLGYDAMELNEQCWRDLVHPEDRATLDKLFGQILAKEETSTLEYRFCRADDTYVYVESVFSNLLDVDEVQGIVVNTREVTERYLQQENLRLLQRAIDTSNNGIVIAEARPPAHQVIYSNRVFRGTAQEPLLQVLNRQLNQGNDDSERNEAFALLSRAIQQQEECSVLFHQTNGEQERWQEFNLSPVYNHKKQLTHFIGILNDITDRKMAEEILRNIVRGVSGAIGEQFFISLVENLAAYLQVNNAVIAKIEDVTKGAPDVTTLAVFRDGQTLPNYQFALNDSICRTILEEGFVYMSDGELENRPDVADTIRTFMGIQLLDSRRRAVGVLYVEDSKPLFNSQIAESILKIFSIRAAAELERISTMQALTESQANLSALIENTTDSIWAINHHYELIALNTIASKFFMPEVYGVKAALGDNIQEASSQKSTLFWQEHYQRALAGERFYIEFDHVLADERVMNFEVSFNPIFGSNEAVAGVSVFAKDISKRKQAELELRHNEANLSALIENTSDIIYSLDSSFNIMTLNTPFQELCQVGFGVELEKGKNLGEYIPPLYFNSWKKIFTRTLAGETMQKEFHYELPTRSIDLEISFNPIFSKEGEISGLTVFGHDITQRKIWEDELKRTNFELDSFVYRASHDLRAPLRSILGLLNISKIEDNAEERLKFLNLIEKSVNKLDTFIIDLTNFSRNTRLEVKAERIDFEHLLNDTVENLRYMDHADKIQCTVEVNREYDFYSDPRRLAIVMQNLVSNAVKYQKVTAPDSFVKVMVNQKQEYAQIVVEDNGKGIDQKHLDRIFEMFFRASEESYGSGLGLYITKQVIEKLKGQIVVTSTPGVGTAFKIKLPNLTPQTTPTSEPAVREVLR